MLLGIETDLISDKEETVVTLQGTVEGMGGDRNLSGMLSESQKER